MALMPRSIGFRPRSGGMIGVDHPQADRRRGSKCRSALGTRRGRAPRPCPRSECRRGGDRAPVHQVAAVPDQQPGSVVKAGVGEVKVVADADRAGVGVVAAEDGIAIAGRGWSGQGKAGFGCKGEGGGVHNKAASSEHDEASVASRRMWSKAIAPGQRETALATAN